MSPRSDYAAAKEGNVGLAPPNNRDDGVVRELPRKGAPPAQPDLTKMVDFLIRSEMAMLRTIQTSLKNLMAAKAALKSSRNPRLVSGMRTATGGDETRNASVLRILCVNGPLRWGQIRDALANDSVSVPTSGAVSGALWDLKKQGVIGQTGNGRWYLIPEHEEVAEK